jgi:hypothetical protein
MPRHNIIPPRLPLQRREPSPRPSPIRWERVAEGRVREFFITHSSLANYRPAFSKGGFAFYKGEAAFPDGGAAVDDGEPAFFHGESGVGKGRFVFGKNGAAFSKSDFVVSNGKVGFLQSASGVAEDGMTLASGKSAERKRKLELRLWEKFS